MSRTLVDSQQKTDERLARLGEATDAKLGRLADTVERLAQLMSRRSHPNGEGVQ